MKIFIIFISILLFYSTSHSGSTSDFIQHNFVGGISMKVPGNWRILDDSTNEDIQRKTDSLTKDSSQSQNKVLIAANTGSKNKTPSATLRLSVRQGKTPTQSDMKELLKLPKNEIQDILAPSINETKQLMNKAPGIRSIKILDASLKQSKNILCIFTESENDTSNGIKIVQTYICPIGDKSIKLGTSYNKSESVKYKPILQDVWSSLKFK